MTGPAAAFDQLLDVYVRDGLVYYRALKIERGKLDRYVASLDVSPESFQTWDRNRRAAFWLNAYNALVLRTVIDRYPIRGKAPGFPPNSVRQIPGAFDRVAWPVAGRKLTLDEIEKTEIAAFEDPRMFFAIGRGAVGGGRLRSEAFDPGRLDAQLTDAVTDCVRRVTCAKVDQSTATLTVSPIFSWREAEFVAASAAAPPAADRYAGRSPIELAVIAFVEPFLYLSERAWLAENRFAMRFGEFDWRLNDLTGGGPK
jgi:hypothetical protein